ncbi:MAG: GldM family protein [Bacteroidales bacterium]
MNTIKEKGNFKVLLCFLFILVLIKVPAKAQCDEKLVDKAIENCGNDALFIRDFRIKQTKIDKKKKNKPVTARFDVRLNQGYIYRFRVENDQNSNTKGMIQLKRENLTLASTYNNDNQQDEQSFDYFCNETGPYEVYFSFIEGNTGCAVGVMLAVVQDSTTSASMSEIVGYDNVLYTGIENFIDIAATNILNGTLDVSVDRGTINKEGGLYKVFVEEPGKLTINVIARDAKGNITESFKSEFKVIDPVLPTISLQGNTGGLIRKEDLLIGKPEISLSSFSSNLNYRIISFTISKSLTEEGINVTGSSYLNQKQIIFIKELKQGETFFIKNLEVQNEKGERLRLSPVGYIIN